ncbi:PhyR family response regulator anti-anti-sigma factor [Swingsia samuiensis]|uniref:Response regulator n=1 Tax=Swingsia samuiensis TaxID=1293412 RepID=A0A4Y6UPB9_9PROT|nr:response regulator [Swingsia samuiensis]QDH17895.1 response regulator [Swingsia samuiensis]
MTDKVRQEFIKALPYARRFARALTGDRAQGDLLLEKVLKRISFEEPREISARLFLYKELLTDLAKDYSFKTGISFQQRALLLLTSLEEQGLESAAKVVGLTEDDAAKELCVARKALQDIAQTTVLIIEDEPIIALDIQDLVERCGHTIAGIAHTETDAVKLAEEKNPGLILADINLGNGGDGMSAVGRILQNHKTPVIFVTAYPERLLQGGLHEPPFIITKPFEPMALAVATYQAVTGGVSPL